MVVSIHSYVNTRIYRDKTLASASGKCTAQVKIDDQWLLFTPDCVQLLHVSRDIIAIVQIRELMKSATALIPEPPNAYTHNAILVKMKNTNGGEKDATTVGHVPDSLAEVLYKPLLEKEIKMTCRVSGQSRSALEGVWVQGGGIEIPCVYEIGVKKGLRSLRKELRDKLIQLVPTTDNTIYLGRHPEPTHVALKT